MKKRWIILILGIVFAIHASAVMAQGSTDTTDTTDTSAPAADTTGIKVIKRSVNPTLDISFSEPVILNSAYLYALNEETEAMLAVGLTPPPIPVINITSDVIVTVWPLVNLFNGLYDLVLSVQDVVGNVATVHQKFIIDVPGTDINVIEPRLGVSDGSTTNLTIETKRGLAPEPTECKITTSAFTYDFTSLDLVPFELPLTTTSTWHTITDFFTKADFRSSAVFYILCLDQAWSRVNRERFEIYVDTWPPAITNFGFNPAKVVEYPEFETNLWAILNITANEPVLCKYSLSANTSYDAMTAFPGFNINDFDAYTADNNTVKVFLPPDTPASYDFYAQCEDRAGWKTPLAKKTLQVDLSAAIGINVIEPRPYTTNRSITLKFSTAKRAACEVGETAGSRTATGTDFTGKAHTSFLGQFDDGTYTYSIRCTAGVGGLFSQEQEMSYTFIIDNTGPSSPNSTGATHTCFSDRFEFVPPITLTGIDEESGISHYIYKLESSTGLIRNWTRTSSDIVIIDDDYKGDSFNLSQTVSYSIKAKSVNRAGLESPESTIAITYDPENIECFEKDPPIVVFSTNNTAGKTTVQMFCEDESGCDNESFYYGLCDTDSCEPTTLLDYPFIVDVFTTKYLAYNVSDIRGYAATGTEKIDVQVGETCNNGIIDGDETAIDCGGSCSGCSLGENCEVNTDCTDNFCSENICTEPKCDDSMLNGPYANEETDVDCGGYCGATCTINQTCNNDGDCISSFCNPDENSCSIATCDDSYKNGGEEGVDCGEECFIDCDDKDGDGIDDDWEERYCDGDCDPEGDLDNDGLSNLREFIIGTNPLVADTDGDGYTDGKEDKAGTDPLDSAEHPSGLIGVLLIIFGLLLMGGGAGYLAYKKYYLMKPKISPKAAAQPGQSARPGAPAGPTPEQLAEQKKMMAEKQRKMMEQRKKQLEERQKKLAELRARIAERKGAEESKKKEMRGKLFEKFGMGKPGIKPKATVKKPISGPVIKPAETGREGWVSFDKLKKGIHRIAKPAAEEKTLHAEKELAKAKDKEFGKLEEIAGKARKKPAKDIFDEMEKSVGEGAIEKEEDIYKKLEKVSKRKKGGK